MRYESLKERSNLHTAPSLDQNKSFQALLLKYNHKPPEQHASHHQTAETHQTYHQDPILHSLKAQLNSNSHPSADSYSNQRHINFINTASLKHKQSDIRTLLVSKCLF